MLVTISFSLSTNEFLPCRVIIKNIVEAERARVLINDPMLKALIMDDMPTRQEPSLDHLISANNTSGISVRKIGKIDKWALGIDHSEYLSVRYVRTQALLEVPVVREYHKDHEKEELSVICDVCKITDSVGKQNKRGCKLIVEERQSVIIPLATILNIVNYTEYYLGKQRDNVNSE